MTPKEKAIELYNKFRNTLTATTANYRAKKIALIAVDEILKNCEIEDVHYWQEVKQEIEKL